MNPTLYQCTACGVTTDRPDFTDASREVVDSHTGCVTWLREHRAVCPACHRALKRFDAVAQTLCDIAQQSKGVSP